MTTVNQKTSTVDERVYARDLQPGQWVTRADTNGSSPMRVLFRSDPDDDHAAQIVVVFKGGHYSFPETFAPDTVFNVATDKQVAEHEATARRMLIGTQLRKLADLIERHSVLPVGTYPSVTFMHDLSEDALSQVAAVIGVKVERAYGDTYQVQFGSYDGFHATWQGRWKDAPDPVELARADAAAVLAAESTAAAPKPSVPKKAAVKRPAPTDRVRAAHDQDDANTRPAGADQ